MSDKYSLKAESNGYYRLIAKKTFTTILNTTVQVGDKGGWVLNNSNLSQDGNCWISDGALVENTAVVSGNALVGSPYAEGQNNPTIVKDSAKIYGSSYIQGGMVFGNAKIYGNAKVTGENWLISGQAEIYENASISCQKNSFTVISGNAKVFGDCIIKEKVILSDNCQIFGNATIIGPTTFDHLTDCVIIYGNAKVYENAKVGNISTSILPSIGGSGFLGILGRGINTTTPVYLYIPACKIYGSASIYGNAYVCSCEIYDGAKVYGNAQIGRNLIGSNETAKVYGSAIVTDYAQVRNNAKVYDNAKLFNSVRVINNAIIHGTSELRNKVLVKENAVIYNRNLRGSKVVGDTQVISDINMIRKDAILQQYSY